VPAAAQSTSTGIRGTVADESGVLPGATVLARDEQNGFKYETVTDGQGFFSLSGMRPGNYEITVSMPQYKPQSQKLQLVIGNNVTLNFKISPDLVYAERVEVVAGTGRIVDQKTAEIATNVTSEQVRYLPQNQRNFLNFANLAPGVKVTQDETNKQITAGGLDGTQINVFIDGVSYKNDVLQGGVVGQDSSRGSPFPQNAVQEFQVLTQNYKAEHEKASSAVITAVTKSGTNNWAGDLFLLYQNKGLVSLDKYSAARDLPKPSYRRYQPGLSVGGPIVKDKLLVFGAYEENRQNRDAQVFLGGTQATAIQLGVRGDYAVNRDFYAAAGGALGYIHNSGLKETQLGLQAALGYRRHLTGPLNMRLEARFTAWGKTDNVSPFDVYSGLIGISTATRAAAPRSGRAAPAARSAWRKQLGVSGGYANIHSVGGGADFVAFALPGYGGGFAGLGAAGVNLPPTIFAIIPIGSKIAIEPGLDIHRAQAGGTTNVNGNFSARLDYAVSGGWYAAFGGNLNYIKSTGVNAATRTGLNLGWGYRFGFLGPLGGRVETSYTLWGKNTDLILPPQNVFAVMFGVTMPLK